MELWLSPMARFPLRPFFSRLQGVVYLLHLIAFFCLIFKVRYFTVTFLHRLSACVCMATHSGQWRFIPVNEGLRKDSDSARLNCADLSKVSTAYYVTNFPPNHTSQELWSICYNFGKISNVYIARKLSKIGKHFAFVKFLGVIDELKLRKELCGIWIENYHIFSSIARFNGGDLSLSC